MSKIRTVVAIIGGLMLIASSVAHTVLGWRQFEVALASLHAGYDLTTGLRFGWYFAGGAMLVFGLQVLIELAMSRTRSGAAPVMSRTIAIFYVACAAWAFSLGGFAGFFAVFAVPALVLVIAAFWPSRAPRAR